MQHTKRPFPSSFHFHLAFYCNKCKMSKLVKQVFTFLFRNVLKVANSRYVITCIRLTVGQSGLRDLTQVYHTLITGTKLSRRTTDVQTNLTFHRLEGISGSQRCSLTTSLQVNHAHRAYHMLTGKPGLPQV